MANDNMFYIVGIVYAMVIFGVLLFVLTKYNEKDQRCDVIDGWDTANLRAGKVDLNAAEVIDDGGNYNVPMLLNYNIKTAYNCCAVNTFKNSFVSECALKNCIKMGARCLDFEIYSVSDKPVIGLSSREANINMKESFNKVEFGRAMRVVNNLGWDEPYGDLPMIIHLRMKTKNLPVYNAMAKDIYNAFEGDKHLLDMKWSWDKFESRTNNMPKLTSETVNDGVLYKDVLSKSSSFDEDTIPITQLHINSTSLKKKVIIIMDVGSLFLGESAEGVSKFTNLLASRRDEDYTTILKYINLISPSKFCRTVRDFDVAQNTDAQNAKSIIENKTKLVFSGPNVQSSSQNVEREAHRKLGIQMIGFCFQNYSNGNTDSRIAKYHEWHNMFGALSRKIDDAYTYTMSSTKAADSGSFMPTIAVTN